MLLYPKEDALYPNSTESHLMYSGDNADFSLDTSDRDTLVLYLGHLYLQISSYHGMGNWKKVGDIDLQSKSI